MDNNLDQKIESAVANGVNKVYEQFQSDMILYDRGDGFGNAFGRKVMGTIIIPFVFGFPVLLLSFVVQWVTGWEGPTCFWFTIFCGVAAIYFVLVPMLERLSAKEKLALQEKWKAEC